MTREEALDKMKEHKPEPPLPNDQVVEIYAALHGHQPNPVDWKDSYAGLWFSCMMTAQKLRREGYGSS